MEANALTERARAVAQEMARLSPKAFTQAKKQLRQEVCERVERGCAMTDQTTSGPMRSAMSATTSRARSTKADTRPACAASSGARAAAPDVLCCKFGYSPRDSVDPRFTNPSFGGLHSPIRRARCTSVIVMFFAPITIAIRPVNALAESSYTA